MTIENQRTVVEILEAGKAKIVEPKNWIKGAFAIGIYGDVGDSDSPSACAFCSAGALIAATCSKGAIAGGEVYWDSFNLLSDVSGGEGIISYNDTHSHEEVMAVWDKAIETAKNRLITMNLERLIQAVEAQPEDEFNLEKFKADKKDQDGNICGTLFCTAGLACTLPEFKEIGMKLVALDGGRTHNVLVGDVGVFSGGADPIFGTRSFRRLFDMRSEGFWDSEHPRGTDKELALWRLNKQLAIYKEKK